MTTTHSVQKIAFIGAGNMATAIAQGLHALGNYQLSVADPYQPAIERWNKDYQATTFNPIADAVILAVKPQQFAQAALSLKTQLSPNTLIISVMAGVTVASISQALNGHSAVVRTMPNTPARIAQGITALYPTKDCSAAQKELAQNILHSIGQTVWLEDESLIDAVTAVSGSGPAYVFYMTQAITQAGIDLGLPADVAKQLTLATFQGAAALAQFTGEPLDQLREQVTSKGGTTAAALGVFKAKELDFTLHAAVKAAHSRAQELARITT